MLADVAAPFALTFRLLWRFWPQLVALVLIGIIAGDLLMLLAAKAAFLNHMLGLALLTFVALTQLIVTVAMFQVLRPGLPEISAAQEEAESEAAGPAKDRGKTRFASMITIALLPFFAYYATWGFLGDTVRQYSRMALDMAPFGERANVLDVLDSRWLLVSVAISWAVRKLAQTMQKRSAYSFWQIVVVICETNWIFVGLYVLSRWKDDWLAWVMSRNFWSYFQAMNDMVVSSAHAASMMPVEVSSIGLATTLNNLFWYMMLPVIWLVMTALVYGYDVRDDKELMRIHSRVERFGERYKAVPAFLRDFVEHFISGYRSRYLPIANGVRITLSSGVILIVTLIVGYRFIDWAAAWLWLGSAWLIGPHDLDLWQILSKGVSLLFGSPFQDSSTGILIEPLRICFLAAILETAFSLPKRAQAAVPQPAE
ncbi:hypothetical protein [Mesorhizobium sp. DCY119]|uniref:hypothetical protein n=1 Tax=Mesorhizobium sp. DCY119 TaxID=2108445 RepID=UPI000E6BD6F2|nr:hypothetical protein [Mesorhizobium sp. DCY119]RJG43078.1 hypothetical protein D3Y55_01520 [Mesorhizobium sp. DCY119]